VATNIDWNCFERSLEVICRLYNSHTSWLCNMLRTGNP